MQLFSTKVIPSAADALWILPEGLPDFAGIALIIFSTPYTTSSAEEQTLAKMMTACRLSAAQYAVIQMQPEQRIAWQTLTASDAPRVILMLGISPAQLAISALFRFNHGNAFLGKTFIPSGTLAQIEQDATMKRELWTQGLKPGLGV